MPTETECDRLARLKAARDEIAMGRSVSEVRFGEDMTKFGRADLPTLERMIREAAKACAIERGETPSRRFAARSGRRFL
ncbi:hypothetical protein SAMN05444339_10266 [Loktanella atrilutea]|uniref:Uncharacterized protein n=1 Tax=Loktanella atrilutea TaxID=366533 RepID=A0A1M4WD45_LOKAT|nr:hypothetical protein [Loktanella atrilutea]SHE78892.1 hypothetical protein SAMN05444339_10266 [Loktanella atrilutea]